MTDEIPETAASAAATKTVKAPKATAADFHPEVLRLFDGYVHGRIDRRGFLEGAARFAVRGVTAAALLEALSPDFANAEQVPKTDARIVASSVEFPSPQGYGTGRGYLVRPASAPPPGGATTPTRGLPTVLVIHENRGLNPHIEDIARRLAVDNFIAFAPDALFPLGGYPGDEDKAREMFARLDEALVVAAVLDQHRGLDVLDVFHRRRAAVERNAGQQLRHACGDEVHHAAAIAEPDRADLAR